MILTALVLQAAEPQTAIEAERAFARDAQELGQWTAFAKWADEDAFLVGRRPINAKLFAASQEDPDQSLRWWPVESYVSCDGQTALNIGGWVDPSSGESGQFHTVWRQTNGNWRYLVDIGSKGSAPMPDTGAVKTQTASCQEATDIVFSHFRAGWTGDMGSSEDNSLHWSWAVDGSGRKNINWRIWNGAHYVSFTVSIDDHSGDVE